MKVQVVAACQTASGAHREAGDGYYVDEDHREKDLDAHRLAEPQAEHDSANNPRRYAAKKSGHRASIARFAAQ